MLGRILRVLHHHVAAAGELARTSRELARHASRERELAVRRDIDAARADAARDFHDVVAHTMTAVHVQLEAALTVFDTDPTTARAAVVDAKRSSRVAQRELRSSVAALRGDGAATRPPDLHDIDHLLDPLRAAGMRVELDTEPAEVAHIPPAVGMTAYRIIQEALTNAAKHSAAHAIGVTVRLVADRLHVEVADDGATPDHRGPRLGSKAAPRDGHGMRGMHERAAAVGGALSAGPSADGGFRVRAVLPITPDRA